MSQTKLTRLVPAARKELAAVTDGQRVAAAAGHVAERLGRGDRPGQVLLLAGEAKAKLAVAVGAPTIQHVDPATKLHVHTSPLGQTGHLLAGGHCDQYKCTGFMYTSEHDFYLWEGGSGGPIADQL